jgi:excinuclease ABC subunit B
MDRRRRLQEEYNRVHGTTPVSIVKSTEEVRLATYVADARTERPAPARKGARPVDLHDPEQRAAAIAALEKQMRQAAANLEFELAALLRDQLHELRALDAPNVRRAGLALSRSGA